MKFTFSISKEDYTAQLAEMEAWLHSFVEYEFGWLTNGGYYITVDGLDEDDAIVYSIRYKLSIIKMRHED